MNTQASILLVDDDRHFSSLTREYLEAKGFRVDLTHNAEDGLAFFRREPYDLCIFDVRMPMKDGFQLAEEVRARDEHIPIIFLTAQTGREHRIRGLTVGGDDYVTKPFSMEELYLRIRAILKRVGFRQQQQPQEPAQPYRIGRYLFHPVSRELHLAEEPPLRLSAIEASLLTLFCERKHELLTRDYALKAIWQDEDQLKGRSLNVYVSRLRTYLAKDGRIEILNVHGEGYRLVVKE